MTTQKQKHQFSHRPVLLDNVVASLQPAKGESYLDLTAGRGGHATEVIKITGSPESAVLIDRDPEAISFLRGLYKAGQSPDILHMSYEEGVKQLHSQNRRFDMILMDLGVSSPQLEDPERGFSYSKEGPLDMRMDQSKSPSAAEIVNSFSQSQLAALISKYGEENKASAIAKQIVKDRPFESTLELSKSIEGVKKRRGKIHPATKTFQAIRIYVNDELGQLERTLPLLVEILNPGGRLCIISFHSLEDRLVKNFLLEESRAGYEARLDLLNKKPIRGDHDDVFNRRARSAKLRAAVKK